MCAPLAKLDLASNIGASLASVYACAERRQGGEVTRRGGRAMPRGSVRSARGAISTRSVGMRGSGLLSGGSGGGQ